VIYRRNRSILTSHQLRIPMTNDYVFSREKLRGSYITRFTAFSFLTRLLSCILWRLGISRLQRPRFSPLTCFSIRNTLDHTPFASHSIEIYKAWVGSKSRSKRPFSLPPFSFPLLYQSNSRNAQSRGDGGQLLGLAYQLEQNVEILVLAEPS
jgi:hypothetical protein